MIRNIIFDLGRVLIKFDPEMFVDRIKPENEEDRQLLLNNIFKAKEWAEMDAGVLDEDEMYEIVKTRIPERLHRKAYELIYNWNQPVVMIEGMSDVVKECKKKGYGLYLLSNASTRVPQYWNTVEGSECFDGMVISAMEKEIKPNRRIYEILLNRFHLKADECLFIDDTLRNVEGAQAVGIKGYHFDGNVEKLRKYLESLD